MINKKSEYCFLCGSLNHLIIEENDEAFECWNCGNPQWIDDMARLLYMVTNKVTLKEAEKNLLKHKPIFCFVGEIDE